MAKRKLVAKIGAAAAKADAAEGRIIERPPLIKQLKRRLNQLSARVLKAAAHDRAALKHALKTEIESLLAELSA